ncbi:MAG TPA: dialkylresorcinol condensing enzyme [Verrucomicrobiae bacterium]|nr:dialkylresorcinol condensing enzyme [Verrucomicrobiae bacterium]
MAGSMRKVLVVYYSQSGQLERAARAVASPLQEAGHSVDYLRLEPARAYPFPWGFWSFLDSFPESVALDPPALAPWSASARYDLVLLAWSPWFLSPAPPTTAFLRSEAARTLLRGTPVVTLTANRGMWMLAHEQVRTLLAEAGARHSDHIALVDPHKISSFVTTPAWLLTGRQHPIASLPRAGVPDAEIAGAARFGRALAAALTAGTLDGSRPVLSGLGAATVDPGLLMSEKVGRRSFQVWSKLVRSAGGPGATARRPVLAIYVLFLIAMIVTVVPLSLLIRTLLKPLLRARLAAQAAAYEQPSGAGTERMREFAETPM